MKKKLQPHVYNVSEYLEDIEMMMNKTVLQKRYAKSSRSGKSNLEISDLDIEKAALADIDDDYLTEEEVRYYLSLKKR